MPNRIKILIPISILLMQSVAADIEKDSKPPTQQTSPSSNAPSMDNYFEPRKGIDLGAEVVKPAWTWSAGVGVAYSDFEARGFPTISFFVNGHTGYFKYTRLGISLYELSNVMLTPSAQYTFYLQKNHLRLQPHAGLGIFLGPDSVTNTWFSRNTLGINAGLSIHYFITSKWAVFLDASSGLFFTSGLRYRPIFILGYTHSIF